MSYESRPRRHDSYDVPGAGPVVIPGSTATSSDTGPAPRARTPSSSIHCQTSITSRSRWTMSKPSDSYKWTAGPRCGSTANPRRSPLMMSASRRAACINARPTPRRWDVSITPSPLTSGNRPSAAAHLGVLRLRRHQDVTDRDIPGPRQQVRRPIAPLVPLAMERRWAGWEGLLDGGHVGERLGMAGPRLSSGHAARRHAKWSPWRPGRMTSVLQVAALDPTRQGARPAVSRREPSTLPDEVGVAVVARVLLDHVQVDPPQGVVLPGQLFAQVAPGHRRARPLDARRGPARSSLARATSTSKSLSLALGT